MVSALMVGETRLFPNVILCPRFYEGFCFTTTITFTRAKVIG
jgi:hypothetical protein